MLILNCPESQSILYSDCERVIVSESVMVAQRQVSNCQL